MNFKWGAEITIPEFIKIGNIVENRSRLWRIDAIEGNIVTATALDGTKAERHRFYVPVEKFKPGRMELPDSKIIGNYATQQLMLRAFKLSMIHGTAPLISLQQSRVIPTEYQLIPVLMSLELPKVRMLLADDIGLGKTIEAGLIISELLGRQRIGRILIVTPASLREQWKEAMEHFFHLEFQIMSTRNRRILERTLPPGYNPWEYYPYIITSIDYAKQPIQRNQILEQRWDMVVFDEAHNIAKPHQSSKSHKIEMARWEFAKKITKKAENLLFLTATPHNGYRDTYASLLRMLVPEGVTGSIIEPRINRDKLKRHVCQRRREDVLNWFKEADSEGSPFPERVQKEIYIKPSEVQINTIKSIEKLGSHLLKSVEKRTEHQKHLANWTIMHLHKRAISSPHALRISLENRIKTVSYKLKNLDEEILVGLTKDEIKASVLDEDSSENIDEEDISLRTDKVIFGEEEELNIEINLLKKSLKLAKEITVDKDRKLHQLIWNIIPERLKEYSKLMIFTRYRDTLNYLKDQITEVFKKKGVDIFILDGTIPEDIRRNYLKDFTKVKSGILIATDCISEGMNLQYASNQIVHYELPWNPNRLEQRNGRVDRYGQPKPKVVIKTLVMDDTLEADILKVLIKKAEQIRIDYGFSPPFFGDETTIVDLIKKHKPSFKYGPQSTLLDFIGQEKVSVDPFDKNNLELIKSDSFYGGIEIGLEEVQQRLNYTYSLIGKPEEIRKFVISGLEKYGCKTKQIEEGVWNFDFSEDFLRGIDLEKSVYALTFDPITAAKNPSLNLIDLGHPIVVKLIEKIKYSSLNEKENYGRTAVVKVKENIPVTTVFHILARYIVDTEPKSIIEELFDVGIEVFTKEVVSIERVEAVKKAKIVKMDRTIEEIANDLKESIELPNLHQIINEQTYQRCSKIIDERKQMKKKLEDEAPKEWLEGIDEISVGSTDIMAVTLYYPTMEGK